jgi:hypothetical protein
MTNKELYRELCKSSNNLPIFMTDWWMDAVCAGKQWDVLMIQGEQGEILAAMPYLLRKRAWMKYIVMPQQTQIGGIWLTEAAADVPDICQKISNELAKMKLCYYRQQYPIGSPAVAAMQKLGFKSEKRITYRIEDLADIEKIVQSFSKNKKRQLQKAQSLHVSIDMNIEDFYRFHVQCLLNQGKQISYTREFLLVLERKAKRLNQCHILSVSNEENQVVAAVFLVWDKRSMYYLIPCYDPQYKDSGACALLAEQAIRLASEKGLAFDFEGSMIAGVANHYKQFGSTATTYYSVEKYYKWWFWFANAYNWLRERRMR